MYVAGVGDIKCVCMYVCTHAGRVDRLYHIVKHRRRELVPKYLARCQHSNALDSTCQNFS